jgi:Tol biopolymer transport system component/DNA-binding winged helix-turn-helix (wHTH) protein
MGNDSFVFRFADVEVREREFTVLKAGKVLAIEPKAFRVLLFLLRNPQRLISKEEMLNSLWGDAAVTEGSLTRCIWLLRRLLEDDVREPHYIETVATVGYRWLCPVEVSDVRVENESAVDSSHIANSAVQTKPRTLLRWWPVGAAVLAIGLVLIAWTIRLHKPVTEQAKTAFPRARTIMLTTFRGRAIQPTFSPDGKQVAYFWKGEDQKQYDIYIQMIGGEQPLRLTWSGAKHICCIGWSPDGQWISFARCNPNGGTIFKVPVLGGPEHKVTDAACLEDARTWWSPDGNFMLHSDRCVPNGPHGLVVFSFATGEKRCLIAPPVENTVVYWPKLSPDGKMVAFLQATTVGVSDIYVIPLEGGQARRLTSDDKWITDLMWAADGRRIVFSSERGGRFSERRWQVPVEGGEVRPETIYPNIGVLSPDGRRLAFVQTGRTDLPSIWRADLSSPGGRVTTQKLIISSAVNDEDPQLSPDGTRIVFVSHRSGDMELWQSDADGSNPLQITSFKGEWPGTPRWSPDGKWIVFDKVTGSRHQIYVIDADGRNLRALTSGDYDNSGPSWSRDGQSIYFASRRSGASQIWKQRLGGGPPVQVTEHGGSCGFESYDGKTLYFTKDLEEGLWRTPVGGGLETRVTAAPRIGYAGNWAISEAGLYLLESDALPRPTIEFYNFKTRRLAPVIPLEHSARPLYPSMNASRDGRTLLFVQWNPQNSIAMVEDFQ